VVRTVFHLFLLFLAYVAGFGSFFSSSFIIPPEMSIHTAAERKVPAAEAKVTAAEIKIPAVEGKVRGAECAYLGDD
jgi:Na+-transporting methylmalonyl-CoA/oxaloacetate decarboxylase gamma subunit